MKKMVGIIHPFDAYQTFYIYENGDFLETIQINMEDIPNTICNLSQTYDINQVDLSGAKLFNQGIVEQIQNNELMKYNKNKLIIRCI